MLCALRATTIIQSERNKSHKHTEVVVLSDELKQLELSNLLSLLLPLITGILHR
jgi:hypothetical protein